MVYKARTYVIQKMLHFILNKKQADHFKMICLFLIPLMFDKLVCNGNHCAT